MRRSIVIVVGILVAVMGSGTAFAGDPEVKKEGPCSRNSEWKLEVRLEDGRFRVRWEADSGISGQRWRLRLRHNGTLIASTIRTTNVDGEAQLRLRGVRNLPGRDTFAGFARNLASGETCSASASL
jgi:hypothetical protein